MNQIQVLDLDVAAKDIYEFYDAHQSGTSYDAIRDLLEKWSIEKFPLFEKMGGRLRIESTEEVPALLKIMAEFKQVSGELHNKHMDKSRKGGPKEEFEHGVIAGILNNFRYLDHGVENVLSNTAFTQKNDLTYFLSSIVPYDNGNTSDFDFTTVMKQKKLTKQISALFNSRINPVSSPRYFSEMERLEYEAKMNRYIAVFPSSFNTALSELKQSLNTTEGETSQFIFSIHPYDFVTMSYNLGSWESCFHPANSYAKAPLAVMIDAATMVSFIPSGEALPTDQYAVFTGNKRFRAMVHFDENLHALLINKVYPSNYRAYVGIANLAAQKAGLVVDTPIQRAMVGDAEFIVATTIYNDLQTQGFFEVLGLRPDENTESCIWYVGNDVPCMGCGRHSYTNYDEGDDDDSPSNWVCPACRYGENYQSCQCCGAPYNPDDVNHDPDSEYTRLCPDCAERISEENDWEERQMAIGQEEDEDEKITYDDIANAILLIG